MPCETAGMSAEEKISKVREKMKAENAQLLVLAALDDIAWLLNLRGNDVECTPVFLSYMIITEEKAELYAAKEIFSPAILRRLKKAGVTLKEYEKIASSFKRQAKGKKVWSDETSVNYHLMNCLKGAESICRKESPVVLMKAVKNQAEQEGMRLAHIKDGAAMCRFLYWFKQNVGRKKITEISAADKLEEFRRQQENFIELSFDTIMGYADHGAIVHYKATKESDREIFARGLLLIDSGAHYAEGTTDITRTIVCGQLTEEEKKGYTLVLKGHLALGAARFKYGCGGEALDSLARGPLWVHGMDYNHGTGHGVGHVLSVHEGPERIHWNAGGNSVRLEEGMIFSNEPGYYEPGKYGVRHENLVLSRECEKNEYGRFMELEALTLVPIDKAGIDMSLMSEVDIMRLNKYHERVWNEISPYLEGEEREWLREATEAI